MRQRPVLMVSWCVSNFQGPTASRPNFAGTRLSHQDQDGKGKRQNRKKVESLVTPSERSGAPGGVSGYRLSWVRSTLSLCCSVAGGNLETLRIRGSFLGRHLHAARRYIPAEGVTEMTARWGPECAVDSVFDGTRSFSDGDCIVTAVHGCSCFSNSPIPQFPNPQSQLIPICGSLSEMFQVLSHYAINPCFFFVGSCRCWLVGIR